MPCFKPRKGYPAKVVNPTGKRSIVWSTKEALYGAGTVTLPCGQCRYCRLETSRNWAVRCMHEASLYENNCFITLTYSDDFLPSSGSLDYDAPVRFMKDLRQEFGPDIRSFGCAEYGSKLQRPHYHLCLFNFDFPDKVEWKKENENTLYVSQKLKDLWPYGFSTIGDLTFESAAYVARYVTKKITGKAAESHYERLCPQTGEITSLLPERTICVSRMPGLGKTWLEKNAEFILNYDFVISRGIRVKPPKYYYRLLEKMAPEQFKKLKEKRQETAKEITQKMVDEDHKNIEAYFRKHHSRSWAHGPRPRPKKRLKVMEESLEAKITLLKRGLEDG